jgi:hypothetical protein
MIHRLFASPTLYSTMAMFFDFPFQELHARLIARTVGRDVKCILRPLRILNECGIIDCRTVGRYRWYRLSDRHPLYEEFDALFRKSRNGRYYPRQDGDKRFNDLLAGGVVPDGLGKYGLLPIPRAEGAPAGDDDRRRGVEDQDE